MHGIRTRLFAAILLAALVPAVPAALLVRDLLQRSRDASLERHLVGGLEAGPGAQSTARTRHPA